MRLSSVAALAAAAAPLAVHAKGQLGYALGVRNQDGSCKNSGEFEKDFAVLKSSSKIFRTYAAIDGGKEGVPCEVPSKILPAAKKNGVKVVLGLWIDSSDNKASFQKDLDAFFDAAGNGEYKDTIYAVTVGSETLYRNETNNTPGADPKGSAGLTGSDLADAIEEFASKTEKAGLKGTYKIGTADSWNKFQDGTANPVVTSPYVDILLVNAFAYWQYQPITNASRTYLDDLDQAFRQIQTTAKSYDKIELWNGETGWPTEGGTTFGDTVPSTKNAQTFFKDGICALINWWDGAGAFYFEAFDEPWKPESIGDNKKLANENHWGAYNVDRSPKFDSYKC